MADVDIKYKGSSIATMNTSGTKTLQTSGKYCEDDIIVEYTDPEKPTQSKTVTPTASGFTVSPDSGKVLSSVVVNGDADLVATNVRKGKNIFGVDGNLEEGIVPSGTKNITVNGNGIDVTQYAAVNVNVPILSKSWEVTFISNQTNVVTLLTDSWLADNYDNGTLAISVVPTFAIPQANACIIGGYRCNFSIAQVSGQTAKTGYRCYHTASNANPSAVYITKNVSGGGTSEAGMIGLESNGTLKIGAPSTYPLLAGSYKITASVQQRGD